MESLNRAIARINEIQGMAAAHKTGLPSFQDVLSQAILTDNPEVDKSISQNTQNKSTAYDNLLQRSAAKYGLDPALLKAVMMTESGGNARAKSKAGASGLMQLMPSTARGLGVTDIFDPAQNIDGGAKYLRRQLDKFGGIRLALAAYNAGPGAVSKHGGIPPYKETQGYVKKVMDLYESYRRGGNG